LRGGRSRAGKRERRGTGQETATVGAHGWFLRGVNGAVAPIASRIVFNNDPADLDDNLRHR
jgi:hypothetical protein